MTKRLVEIDDADLDAARVALSTSTIRETVTRALREVAASAGLLATYAALDLEALYSARTPQEYREVRADRRLAYEYLPTGDEDWQRALQVQATLAEAGRWRGVGLADLVISAVAERHRVTVLHYDGDYDGVAAVTGQSTEWVVPAGSVP